ncbi:MAG: hypothetical protein RBR08_15750 [Desulforegulaceae bacterium]|nr:hypothetical protein [Desulforegulaceae bacterium]
MKKISIFAILFFLSASASSWSEENSLKYNQIMLGTHAIIIDNDVNGYKDDELAGIMLSYQRSITKIIALRAGYFLDEHDDYPELESKGIEAQLLFGNNFLSKGFYFYGGLGFFNENWEYSDKDLDLDFNGILLSLGLGYKWEHIIVDFIFNIRDASDYEDKLNEWHGNSYTTIDASASSGSLSIGIRF